MPPGAVWSTVTDAFAWAVFPTESVAIAQTTYVPSAGVVQVVEYGAPVSVKMSVPVVQAAAFAP